MTSALTWSTATRAACGRRRSSRTRSRRQNGSESSWRRLSSSRSGRWCTRWELVTCSPRASHTSHRISTQARVQGCVDALGGSSTRDEYESHCGLAGHIGQQHFFPPGTFNGMQRPLHSELALSGGPIVLTAAATAANEYLLITCARARLRRSQRWFAARTLGAFYAEGVSPPPCITTDACTGPDAPSPGVGVWMEGLWCRWAITRFWQAFHITFLEYVGQRMGELRMAPYVRHEPAVLRNSDNMAACVAQLKGSKSTAIDTAHRFSKTNAVLVDLDMRSFQNHMAGRLLWFADAISRDKIVELNSVCHTLHIRHKNVGLNEQVQRLHRRARGRDALCVSGSAHGATRASKHRHGKVVRFQRAVHGGASASAGQSRSRACAASRRRWTSRRSRTARAKASTGSPSRSERSMAAKRDEVISSLSASGGGARPPVRRGTATDGAGCRPTACCWLGVLHCRGGSVEAVLVGARMLFARGTFVMAATASAVTRGHVPSHQQQYDVPVRPPVVQVWYLKRYNYSPTGRIGDVQHGLERMEQGDYYQFPAALDAGEFRSRDDMLQSCSRQARSAIAECVSHTGTTTGRSARPCPPRMTSCSDG